MIGIETWALGILAVAVLGLFGYVFGVSNSLHAFKLHVAEDYARAGAIEREMQKLTVAVNLLTEKLTNVSEKVAVFVARSEK